MAIVDDPAPAGAALRPSPDVIAKRLDQAAVLVHIPTSRIFELNETGTRIWELLGQGLNPERIARRLVEEFDVEDARASEEVSRLLTRLATEGLLAS
jgi:hypothetical protein